VILEHKSLAGEPAEIDKYIGALGPSQYQASRSDWNIPEAALGPDLPEIYAADVEV
jgi:hypothetical protein